MSFEAIDWATVEKKVADLTEQVALPNLDQSKRMSLGKELAHLRSILDKYKDIKRTEEAEKSLLQQKDTNKDTDLNALFDEEIEQVRQQNKKDVSELENLLYPPDEQDNLPVFLEIRAGAGGQEAALFAGDLARMYMMYAQQKGWRASAVSESPTDLGGYREVILHIQGKGVYGHLKFESGVHRVQRVPATETSGRVHTSTATVAVLPETEEIEKITINPADLRIDTYRAGGAGGQHVNKTDSAVRITHIPTGIVVACQDDRSQHKNRAKAMKILGARLLSAQKEKQDAQMSAQRKEQVGTGMRAEKVRTYNFPQNRVSDHQVDVTLNKLDMVMDGALDDIIEPLREHDRAQRRQKASSLLA